MKTILTTYDYWIWPVLFVIGYLTARFELWAEKKCKQMDAKLLAMKKRVEYLNQVKDSLK